MEDEASLAATILVPPGAAWASAYQRSNKKGGKKHLRCFPFHLDHIHSKSRACHIPLLVQYDPGLYFGEEASCFVRFRCETQTAQDMDCGSLIEDGALRGLVRSPEAPLNPVLQARLAKDETLRFYGVVRSGNASYFELSPLAWHYGWAGSRYKQELQHHLLVYVMVRQEPEHSSVLKCVARANSPPFRIYCARSAKSTQGRLPNDRARAPATKRPPAGADGSPSSAAAAPRPTNKRRLEPSPPLISLPLGPADGVFVEAYNGAAQPAASTPPASRSSTPRSNVGSVTTECYDSDEASRRRPSARRSMAAEGSLASEYFDFGGAAPMLDDEGVPDSLFDDDGAGDTAARRAVVRLDSDERIDERVPPEEEGRGAKLDLLEEMDYLDAALQPHPSEDTKGADNAESDLPNMIHTLAHFASSHVSDHIDPDWGGAEGGQCFALTHQPSYDDEDSLLNVDGNVGGATPVPKIIEQHGVLQSSSAPLPSLAVQPSGGGADDDPSTDDDDDDDDGALESALAQAHDQAWDALLLSGAELARAPGSAVVRSADERAASKTARAPQVQTGVALSSMLTGPLL